MMVMSPASKGRRAQVDGLSVPKSSAAEACRLHLRTRRDEVPYDRQPGFRHAEMVDDLWGWQLLQGGDVRLQRRGVCVDLRVPSPGGMGASG